METTREDDAIALARAAAERDAVNQLLRGMMAAQGLLDQNVTRSRAEAQGAPPASQSTHA